MDDDATNGMPAPDMGSGTSWRRGAMTAEIANHHNDDDRVEVGLTAVALSVQREQPVVLATTLPSTAGQIELPSTRFTPLDEPSLEMALRAAVEDSTGCRLGYVEQLLTAYAGSDEQQMNGISEGCLSVSYLALTRADDASLGSAAQWVKCYDLLPWEDFRGGRPTVLDEVILPRLEVWINDFGASEAERSARKERFHIAFGSGERGWDDQCVIERLDLVHDAGVVDAATRREAAISHAHLRLIAAGLGRLRSKTRYRPVVFELLAREFTLFELQRTVEAVLGPTLHKQNFRRLVEGTGLVEPTGDVRTNTGGRPAKVFRFRREVLLERPAPGVHVRAGRAA
jgi:hypothetical protein